MEADLRGTQHEAETVPTWAAQLRTGPEMVALGCGRQQSPRVLGVRELRPEDFSTHRHGVSHSGPPSVAHKNTSKGQNSCWDCLLKGNAAPGLDGMSTVCEHEAPTQPPHLLPGLPQASLCILRHGLCPLQTLPSALWWHNLFLLTAFMK